MTKALGSKSRVDDSLLLSAPRYAIVGTAALVLLFLGVAASVQAQQQAQVPQMQQQARYALQHPVKVDVRPLEQGKKTGEKVAIEVILRDGENKPVDAAQTTTVELESTTPSGKVNRQTVEIPKGQSSVKLPIQAAEPGVTKLTVREQHDRLMNSSNYLLVTPTKQQKKVSPKSSPAKAAPRPTSYRDLDPRFRIRSLVFHPAHSPMVLRRTVQPDRTDGNLPATAFDSTPRLMMQVSGENEAEPRADGRAAARIAIFYMASDPTPSDIKVWFSWSGGEVRPQPLIIKKGEYSGEAHWTSHTIGQAPISIRQSSPQLPFDRAKQSVNFVEPILGLGFLNPPPTITIVDSVPLTAGFFDSQGKPIQTVRKRTVTFASNNPVLRLKPGSHDVDPGKANCDTVLLPSSMGTSIIEASAPGFPPAHHVVAVVVGWVLAFWIVGSVLGGVAAYATNKQQLWAQLLTAIIGGGVLSWAYVYLGLPKVDSGVFHTQISVLFISMIGGFGGIKSLRFVAQKLGLAV